MTWTKDVGVPHVHESMTIEPAGCVGVESPVLAGIWPAVENILLSGTGAVTRTATSGT